MKKHIKKVNQNKNNNVSKIPLLRGDSESSWGDFKCCGICVFEKNDTFFQKNYTAYSAFTFKCGHQVVLQFFCTITPFEKRLLKKSCQFLGESSFERFLQFGNAFQCVTFDHFFDLRKHRRHMVQDHVKNSGCGRISKPCRLILSRARTF